MGEYLYAYLTYKLYNTEVFLNTTTDPAIYPPNQVSGFVSSAAGSLVFDKRNDRWSPSDGIFASASVEQAGLGGDLKFTKGLANARYYKQIFWKLVFRNNLTYGVVASPPGVPTPFTQLFLLGGSQSLRGYTYGRVGKKALTTCCTTTGALLSQPALIPYGGTQQLYYQAEIEYPLVTEAGIKGVFFYDIGTADDAIILSALRQDLGFGFRWFSPIGPLRFEWGFPIDRRDDELYQNFEFSIGSPF
ncbi:MAG: BamA/TamA family outer membrane protein [Oligoflexia bacterium]|nr:BamA/TamA family outer membrane protein [Oligoflexia bacterium]